VWEVSPWGVMVEGQGGIFRREREREGMVFSGCRINLLTPNVNYSGRTAPLTSKVAFYIFIQQI